MKKLTEQKRRQMRETAEAFLKAAFPVDPTLPADMHDQLKRVK